MNADLFVIDRFLDGWGLRTFENILKDIKKDIPIVIVSARWNTERGFAISEIMNFSESNNILDVYSWEEVGDYSLEVELRDRAFQRWKQKIYTKFLINQKKYPKALVNNENINLLHIADLQFGGPESESSFGDRYAIARFLKDSMLKPDFIAICGDIAQSGKAKEYSVASSWFNDFAQTLFGGKKTRAYFSSVPGNHDCNFDSFAQYSYKYDFQVNGFIESESSKPWIDSNYKIILENDIFANYLRFVNDLPNLGLTCEQFDHLNMVNDCFLHWGIRFIHLNTMDKITPDNPSGVGINESEMEKLIQHCIGKTKGLFTIILSHHGPVELGYDITNRRNEWSRVEQLLKHTNAKLWLYGHRHELIVRDIVISEDKTVPAIATGSLRLSTQVLPEGSQRGFNLIELVRDNRIVTHVNIKPYKINRDSISPSRVIEYKINENL